MDPIKCANVNGSDYCWVQASGGEKNTETEPLGAYLFPVIQHFDQNCMNCSFGSTGAPDGKPLTCNEVNLEFLLFFNPSLVHQPHYIAIGNNSNLNDGYRLPPTRKVTPNNAGLDGVIYMNFCKEESTLYMYQYS